MISSKEANDIISAHSVKLTRPGGDGLGGWINSIAVTYRDEQTATPLVSVFLRQLRDDSKTVYSCMVADDAEELAMMLLRHVAEARRRATEETLDNLFGAIAEEVE